MLNSHDSQLFSAPMRSHEYSTPPTNQSPPLGREYSLLQTHSPTADENSIGVKIEYVDHNALNQSPDRYGGGSPKYDQGYHDDGRIKELKTENGNNQTYVTLPPFLN